MLLFKKTLFFSMQTFQATSIKIQSNKNLQPIHETITILIELIYR